MPRDFNANPTRLILGYQCKTPNDIWLAHKNQVLTVQVPIPLSPVGEWMTQNTLEALIKVFMAVSCKTTKVFILLKPSKIFIVYIHVYLSKSVPFI
jgi:hypothetical protein